MSKTENHGGQVTFGRFLADAGCLEAKLGGKPLKKLIKKSGAD
jgi:hypothetical protein